MKSIFKPGDKKDYLHQVTNADTAIFGTDMVHPVYATFALARDAEWACRQFVLEMKEADEEGIGTSLTVNHKSPALVGDEVKFTAMVKSISGHEIICAYTASVGSRLVADGETGQKILKKTKIETLFASIR